MRPNIHVQDQTCGIKTPHVMFFFLAVRGTRYETESRRAEWPYIVSRDLTSPGEKSLLEMYGL